MIREVRIVYINNRFYSCTVRYCAQQMTYRYLPKQVSQWIIGKWVKNYAEERGDDFIDIDIYVS